MSFELTKQVERHLTGDRVAWLTTITPSGWPAPNIIWFTWDGTAITIYSVPDGAKVRHIKANDKVTVHFESDSNDADIVVISGRASVVPDAPLPSAFPGFLDKYQPRIDEMGQTAQWYDDGYSTALRVVPERVRAFG